MTPTIAAIATPPGRGGIGIIRVSGCKAQDIAKNLLGFLPKPRFAHYSNFHDATGTLIDQGIILYFPAPNSFTGEDVLELHGHGGPVVQDCLLRHILQLGAQLARPGEFSERAFLNNKLDLIQAEAIADLITAGSEQAARAALRSLQGEFSELITKLTEDLIKLRIYVEAAIDFPEEEIDFLTEGGVATRLEELLVRLKRIYLTAQQGTLLRDGMVVVIAGEPNAGKSSLLNLLCGRELAIVTDIPGTTRDVLRDAIQIDGLPLHIIDTAGLRESKDLVEQEGIRRAWEEIKNADQVLLVTDCSIVGNITLQNELLKKIARKKITIIRNKIDLLAQTPDIQKEDELTIISLSAKTGAGITLLRDHLKECMGFKDNLTGSFSARRRHLNALAEAEKALQMGQQQLSESHAGELLAEDLRSAQQALAEITGQFTTEELLGRIFSSFCIGK